MEFAVASLIYRQMLAHITANGGNVDVADLTRYLRADVDPGGEIPYVAYLNVTRQAFRDWAAAQALNPLGGPLADQGPFPTDPTLPNSGADLRTRILVTATNPDGSTVSTLVVFDTSGALTVGEAISQAIAQVQRDRGTNLVPPTFDTRAASSATYTGEIITIGRRR